MTNRLPRNGKVIVTIPHKRFLAITNSRYNDLRKRVRKFYRMPTMELPYTLDQYRDWCRKQLNGEGGACRCYYCDAVIALETMQTEHRTPLAQAGALQFENLVPSCEPCNQQKGMMRHTAFAALLRLANDHAIFTEIDRTNLLGRLQIAMKLQYAVRKYEKTQ